MKAILQAPFRIRHTLQRLLVATVIRSMVGRATRCLRKDLIPLNPVSSKLLVVMVAQPWRNHINKEATVVDSRAPANGKANLKAVTKVATATKARLAYA